LTKIPRYKRFDEFEFNLWIFISENVQTCFHNNVFSPNTEERLIALKRLDNKISTLRFMWENLEIDVAIQSQIYSWTTWEEVSAPQGFQIQLFKSVNRDHGTLWKMMMKKKSWKVSGVLRIQLAQEKTFQMWRIVKVSKFLCFINFRDLNKERWQKPIQDERE